MSRIEREQLTVAKMIKIYCRHKENNRELCPNCLALLQYATTRLAKCPFGERKTSCRKCAVHCYSLEMKVKIKLVMRYSGPRMILYHPIAAIRHVIAESRM